MDLTLPAYRTIKRYEPARAASDIEYASSRLVDRGFLLFDDAFEAILGHEAELRLVERRPGVKFAHEAGVFVEATNAIYFTANYATSKPIDLFRIECSTHTIERLHYSHVSSENANGACNYEGQVLYCCQGTLIAPSSLVLVDPETSQCRVMLNNLYGRQFNSLNDVIVHHPSGDILFTDPTYGFEQGFRPRPQLPSQVYRFRPRTGEVWCIADGFGQCNGLCFSPDYTLLYVTDTAAVQDHEHGAGKPQLSFDPRLPSCIYVFDVDMPSGNLGLGQKRMFAQCLDGVPDGIKCDTNGNVYSGCGHGIHVWDQSGRLVGKILVGGMVANFCFSPYGIWIFAEEELYLCNVAAEGALIKTERGRAARGVS